LRNVSSKFWTAGVFVCTLAAASLIVPRNLAGDVSTPPWVAPARACRKPNPISPNTTSISAGHAIYCDQCLCCHGSNGKGDGPSASDLTPRPEDLSSSTLRAQSDGALFWKITNGRDPMPGFDNLVCEKDRWSVINYLRTLEPRPTTVASTQHAQEAANDPR
jgi:mono/diheme cytochrome c family protein